MKVLHLKSGNVYFSKKTNSLFLINLFDTIITRLRCLLFPRFVSDVWRRVYQIVMIIFENKTPFWIYLFLHSHINSKSDSLFHLCSQITLSIFPLIFKELKNIKNTIFKPSSFEIMDVSFCIFNTHYLGNDSWSKTYPDWTNYFIFYETTPFSFICYEP